jgi:hypothetical protein
VDFSILSQMSLGRADGMDSDSCVLYLLWSFFSFFGGGGLFAWLLSRGDL